jgi:alpha-tubulin suppressor-like RCC1 family protein
VRCWGSDGFGQLGDGQTESGSSTPTGDVLTDVQAIAAGDSHTCAVMTSGGLRCWGRQSSSEFGDNSVGFGTTRATPPTADGFGGVQEVAAGFESTCVLLVDGTIRCAGVIENLSGRMEYVLGAATSVTMGSQGAFGCALTNSESVRCWGYQSTVLGINARLGDPSPVTGVLMTNIRSVSAGSIHACVVTTSGGLRCWGANENGQLGDGTTVDHATLPSQDLLTGVKAVATGTRHTCALMMSGAVRCWGGWDQYSGTKNTAAVDAVDLFTGAQVLAAGGSTCAIMSSGGVRCWDTWSPPTEGAPKLVPGTCSN